MSSIRWALPRWSVVSAIALSILASSTITLASESGTLSEPTKALQTASVYSAPFDLVTNDQGRAPSPVASWVFVPPFDLPGDQDGCVVCRIDDAPFLLFSL